MLWASIHWYMREGQRGTVSSSSRSRTVLVQQYSANISVENNIIMIHSQYIIV